MRINPAEMAKAPSTAPIATSGPVLFPVLGNSVSGVVVVVADGRGCVVVTAGRGLTVVATGLVVVVGAAVVVDAAVVVVVTTGVTHASFTMVLLSRVTAAFRARS